MNRDEWQQVGCSYYKRSGNTIGTAKKRACFGCGGVDILCCNA